ncbi:unnamed protein product [Durusdinium trenchii]|uniref:Uncharacterized protein n=1 Tax=Durusdinium trenchii TaxID=1381693 RepID=A0ABP0III2_9DINO
MATTRSLFSKGPDYVPLEVSTHSLEDEADEDPGTYRYRPLSQRMRRRSTRPVRCWSRIVGGVAVFFVVAAVALWIWAVVLLLVRLHAMRQSHVPPNTMQDGGEPTLIGPVDIPMLAPPSN